MTVTCCDGGTESGMDQSLNDEAREVNIVELKVIVAAMASENGCDSFRGRVGRISQDRMWRV